MSVKAYAGIGSTTSPTFVCDLIQTVAAYLAQQEWTLRSGHALGADQAFEKGCDEAKGRKEIYLPWPGFEGSKSPLHYIPQRAFILAEKFHPNWAAVEAKQGAQKMLARDVLQVLGPRLDDPVEGVICWTPGGKGGGGTGQALRIAAHYDIPILDLGRYEHNAMDQAVGEFLCEQMTGKLQL